MTLYVKASAFFVGGAVMLDFRDSTGVSPTGTFTITRTATQGINTGFTDTVCSNAAITPLWLDQGEGVRGSQTITGPLAPGQYTYHIVATVAGQTLTIDTPAVLLAKTITIVPDGMNDVLIMSLRGALRILTMPPGMHVPIVYNAMPVGDFPPLPLVSVNEEMIQQLHIPIGQDAWDVEADNTVTISSIAKRMWRISVFSASAQERDFLRDYLIAVLHVLAKDLFEPLGRNTEHKFQAVTYSTAKDGETPGFFGSDILYETGGTYNTSLGTSFGVIDYIVGVANPE